MYIALQVDLHLTLQPTFLQELQAPLPYIGVNTGSNWGLIWGFPKIRGTSLGAPIIRTKVNWGLY